MKRETLQLNKYIVSAIADWYQDPEDDEVEDFDLSPADEYELVEPKTITSVDEYDGGYDAFIIIKRKSDNKFFKLSYQEWDISEEKGGWVDYEPEFTEVFPVTGIKTFYE